MMAAKARKKKDQHWKLTKGRPLRVGGTIFRLTNINRKSGGVTLKIETPLKIKRIKPSDIDGDSDTAVT